MNAGELKKIIEEKGMDWLIDALVDGSIGYHSPKHAMDLIERALKGEKSDWCERCMCCFKSDLMAMIESDIERMRFTEKYCPERVPKLTETIKQILAMNLTPIQEMGFSCAYPTLSI